MVPPEGMRRWNVAITNSVSLATVSWMRLDAAAVPPSTARNALVIATDILLASKGTTVPLRLMTRNLPGAVAAIAPLTMEDSFGGVMTSVEVSPWLISVCMFSPKFLALVPASDFFYKCLHGKTSITA